MVVSSAEEFRPAVVGTRMAVVLEGLRAAARMDHTILLQGPSGVGKTWLAKYVHALSMRRNGPFVTVDLLGVPQGAADSALFGVAEGVFTGVRGGQGHVAAAEGGTLFIDEIDKLSLEMQAKLLRLLDMREYTVVGTAVARRADLRIIVATNVDLAEQVARGKFYADLYYRISILPCIVPPLIDRRDEILGWARTFLRLVSGSRGKPQLAIEFDASAEAALLSHDWPGNLRELNAVVVRAMVLAVRDAGHDDWDQVSWISERHVREAIGNSRIRSLLSDSGSQESTGGGRKQEPTQAENAVGLPAAVEQIAESILGLYSRSDGADVPPIGELMAVLQACVWVSGVRATGSANRAAVLLKENKLVSSRNYSTVVRRAGEKWTSFKGG